MAARGALCCLFFWGVVGVRKTPETAFTGYDNEKQNRTRVNSEFNIRRDRFRCGTKCYALPLPTSTAQAAIVELIAAANLSEKSDLCSIPGPHRQLQRRSRLPCSPK